MATRNANSIRLTHTTPQNNFRLLELSPEFLEELSSNEEQPLYIKSLPSATHWQNVSDRGNLPSNEPEYVNLCTQTKTYRLLTVQSTNSIILVKPSLGKVEKGDATAGEATVPDFQDTVTAVAQCGTTLELRALEDGSTAIGFLEYSLPIYDHLGAEEDVMDVEGDSTSMTKDAVLNDIPMSPAECEQAWVELCAFVHTDGKKTSCWRPSAKAKLEVWKKILEGSVIHGIELDKQFLVRDLWKAASDDEDDESPFHKDLFGAVVRRLADKQSLEGRKHGETELKWANFDKDVNVRWVAETYLEATAPNPATAISRTEFLNNWKDNLPEAWRSQASWASLKDGRFAYTDAQLVYFSRTGISSESNAKNSKNRPKR